jgi:hypothetical protein
MESQNEQNEQHSAARRVSPESPSDAKPRMEKRPSHPPLRLDEDIYEAIMPGYLSFGGQAKAQTNRAAATRTPYDQFTCPDRLLQSYLVELENRREICAQHNGGRPDLGTAEILNTIGLHYHHVTHDHKSSLACHQEALGVLTQITSDLLSEVSSSSSSTAHEPPPLPGSAAISAEQEALLKEAYVQTAITFTDVGNAYKSRGDNESALQAYNEALAVFRMLGMEEDHPRVAATIRCVERIDQHFEGGRPTPPILPSHNASHQH